MVAKGAVPSPGGADGPSVHFAALDGMRGLLAFGVVFFHFGLNSFLERSLGFPGFALRLCVDVFFLLSGYVLTHSARRRLDRRRFVIKRIARLLPVYYACLVVLIAIMRPPLADWLLITPFYGLELVNGPGWSICAELFFPIAAVLSGLRVPDRLVRPLLVLVLLALGWLDLPLPVADANHLSRGAVGLLGGHLLYRARLGWQVSFLSALATMIGLMAGAMVWPALALLLPFVAALVILGGTGDSGLLTRQPFQWLGVLSYTVYLSHWPVLLAMQRLWGQELGANPALKMAGIATATLAAWVLTMLVERPGMRLGALGALGGAAGALSRNGDLAAPPGAVKEPE